MQEKMELNDYIKKWSEKTLLSEDEIKTDYNNLIEEEKSIHTALSDEEHQTRALQRLAMNYKKMLRSPAVGFEGVIIAATDPIDTVARIRREAIDAYNENPEIAIQQGLVDNDGCPLDNRKTWSSGKENFGYGKPLPEHNWTRNIWGVAKKTTNDEKPKFFHMSINGDKANEEVYMFNPVKFRAIDKSQDSDEYNLNSSMVTKFEPINTEFPQIKDLIVNYCGKYIVPINNLSAYHDVNENEFNRLCIVEGDVSSLMTTPTAFGSRVLTLEDPEKMDIDENGITCWIPMGVNIDFAEQSKVYVVGRTSRGKKRDEQGNLTEEPGDVMINAYGLYAIPEFKIEQELIEVITPQFTENPEELKEPKEKTEEDW